MNLVYSEVSECTNALDWANTNASKVSKLLKDQGALLIRGLPIQESKMLADVLKILFDKDLMEYTYRSTPRKKLRGRIYTSTEYHSDKKIVLHSENSYSNNWPMKIAFYCMQSAQTGGNTPIADTRRIYSSIPEEIRFEFEQKKLLYIRNYGDIDLPWQEVFQTQNKLKVEDYCRNNMLDFEWIGASRLRTRQLNSATSVHPVTKEKVWFNQAHLFHISSLEKSVRQSLLNTMQKTELPRNVFFGDGSEISGEIIENILMAFKNNEIVTDWKNQDLLLLDNMLYAHGRQPFTGNRKVLVGMA